MINQTKNLITRLANYALEHPASFLKRTAAVNFSVGSVGLIIGMLINDKIPAKEKRFMISQEAVEGCLDLGVFLVVASAFEKAGRWLVKTKRLLPHIEGLGKEQVKEAVTKFFLNPKNPQGLSIAAEGRIRTIIKASEVGAGLLGTILAFNLITPLIRNKLASKLEKKFEKKVDKTQTYSPILPAVSFSSGYTSNSPFAGFETSIKTGVLPLHKPVNFNTGMKI